MVWSWIITVLIDQQFHVCDIWHLFFSPLLLSLENIFLSLIIHHHGKRVKLNCTFFTNNVRFFALRICFDRTLTISYALSWDCYERSFCTSHVMRKKNWQRENSLNIKHFDDNEHWILENGERLRKRASVIYTHQSILNRHQITWAMNTGCFIIYNTYHKLCTKFHLITISKQYSL